MSEIRRANRDQFAASAAPEAIGAHLATARRKAAALAEEIDWLATLLARRQRQVADGTWPPAREQP